jgi:hypothetical protein
MRSEGWEQFVHLLKDTHAIYRSVKTYQVILIQIHPKWFEAQFPVAPVA